jgi:hypothetical protein
VRRGEWRVERYLLPLKVERSEMETVVQEFRRFLEAAVDGEEKDQTKMVEIR